LPTNSSCLNPSGHPARALRAPGLHLRRLATAPKTNGQPRMGLAVRTLAAQAEAFDQGLIARFVFLLGIRQKAAAQANHDQQPTA